MSNRFYDSHCMITSSYVVDTDKINQSIKFISKCKNSAHSKHVMHLGGTDE